MPKTSIQMFYRIYFLILNATVGHLPRQPKFADLDAGQVSCLHRLLYMELFHDVSRIARICHFANDIFGPSQSQIRFVFFLANSYNYNTFDTFYMEAARKCPWTAGPNKSAMAPFHSCRTRFFENIVMTSLHKIWNLGGPCDRSHRQSTPHWSHGMSFFHLFPWLGWYGVPQF